MEKEYKSKELIDRFHKESYIDLREKDAIEYSTIAVDEIMSEIRILLCDTNLSQNSIKLFTKRYDYWQEVKEYLNKLKK